MKNSWSRDHPGVISRKKLLKYSKKFFHQRFKFDPEGTFCSLSLSPMALIHSRPSIKIFQFKFQIMITEIDGWHFRVVCLTLESICLSFWERLVNSKKLEIDIAWDHSRRSKTIRSRTKLTREMIYWHLYSYSWVFKLLRPDKNVERVFTNQNS